MKKRLALALCALVGMAAQSPVAPMPKTETATIHVYRPWHFVGFAIAPSIYCDGIEIQRLHNGEAFVASVPVGKHMITAGRSEVGQLVEFQAGEQYFFKFGHKNWFGTAVSGRQPVTLSQVPEEEAQPEIRKIKRH
jgi:Protein of unknown function (DUF2846)